MNICKAFLFTILLGSWAIPSLQARSNKNSLFLHWQKETNDSIKLSQSIRLIHRYPRKEKYILRNKALFTEGIRLCEKLNIPYKKGVFWDLKGVIARNKSLYDTALHFHFKAQKALENSPDQKAYSHCLNNIGVVYRRIDALDKAIEFHLKALKIAERINDKRSVCVAQNSIGNILSIQEKYEEALEYFNLSLILEKENNNKLGIAINLNNIGETYELLKDYKKALDYYQQSLVVNEEINSLKGKSISYFCVAKMQQELGNNELALKFYNKASDINKVLRDTYFTSANQNGLASLYLIKKEYEKALASSQKALQMAIKIGNKAHARASLFILSKIYEETKRPVKSLEYYKQAIAYNDSILNEKNSKIVEQLRTVYDTEKKETQIKLLLKEQKINDEELKTQKAYLITLSTFLIALLSVIWLLLRNNRLKKAKNRLLLEQKEEITSQNEVLMQHKNEIEKQRNELNDTNQELIRSQEVIENYIVKITDSIRYAEKIQHSLLPPVEKFNKWFPENFVFYQPKDIVSGDFFWAHETTDAVLLAVADCTGHGVPGAFMSILGNNLLKQAVIHKNITQPSLILDDIHIEIQQVLQASKNEVVRDGMDISICKFYKNSPKMEFSGALMPAYLSRDGEIITVRPDLNFIGVHIEGKLKKYTNHSLLLQDTDIVYLLSDGFSSQFNAQNKKFNKQQLLNLLAQIQEEDMAVQKQVLQDSLNSWKGDSPQIDDIMVIGVKKIK